MKTILIPFMRLHLAREKLFLTCMGICSHRSCGQ
jgi:hypothetical protein